MITELLARINAGDAKAVQPLYEALYPEIKRIARARLRSVGDLTELNATGLVHEGFLHLADREGIQGESRGQFLAYVSRVLRHVVLDHLRARQTEKRGGDCVFVTLSHADSVSAAEIGTDLEALSAAMDQLQALDLRLYELVEMRYFGGMTLDEIAALRGVTTRTINRDWQKARMKLADFMGSASK